MECNIKVVNSSAFCKQKILKLVKMHGIAANGTVVCHILDTHKG